MICTCKSKGIRELETMRTSAMRRLGVADPAALTSAIIFSLAFDFGADANVYMDQWFGISVRTPLRDKSIFIECDEPEGGLLYLWGSLDKEFPDRCSARGPGVESDFVAASDASRALVDAIVAAERASKIHHSAHSGKYAHECMSCRQNMDVEVDLHIKVGKMWGADTMLPEIDRILGKDDA